MIISAYVSGINKYLKLKKLIDELISPTNKINGGLFILRLLFLGRVCIVGTFLIKETFHCPIDDFKTWQ